MVVREGSSLITNQQTGLSRNTGDDVIVVDIVGWGEKMLRIANIHDQRTREPGERPVRRLSWQKIISQGGGGTVLAGDFNAHSQRWCPRCTERRDPASWEDIID